MGGTEGTGATHCFVKGSPLEGPCEAHSSILLDGVGIGLFAFGALPCLHWSIGPGIHALSPGEASEEGGIAS